MTCETTVKMIDDFIKASEQSPDEGAEKLKPILDLNSRGGPYNEAILFSAALMLIANAGNFVKFDRVIGMRTQQFPEHVEKSVARAKEILADNSL